MPNVRIRTMRDQIACSSVALEDGNNLLCPPLLPGQIVEVPDGHPVLTLPRLQELVATTTEATNREYQYADLQGAMGASLSREKAEEAAMMVQTGINNSVVLRQQNAAGIAAAQERGEQPGPEHLAGTNAALKKAASAPPPSFTRS